MLIFIPAYILRQPNFEVPSFRRSLLELSFSRDSKDLERSFAGWSDPLNEKASVFPSLFTQRGFYMLSSHSTFSPLLYRRSLVSSTFCGSSLHRSAPFSFRPPPSPPIRPSRIRSPWPATSSLLLEDRRTSSIRFPPNSSPRSVVTSFTRKPSILPPNSLSLSFRSLDDGGRSSSEIRPYGGSSSFVLDKGGGRFERSWTRDRWSRSTFETLPIFEASSKV